MEAKTKETKLDIEQAKEKTAIMYGYKSFDHYNKAGINDYFDMPFMETVASLIIQERDKFESLAIENGKWAEKVDEEFMALSERVRELEANLESVNEAFENYALRRKEKGTATLKINTWNTLVFRMGEVKSILSKK